MALFSVTHRLNLLVCTIALMLPLLLSPPAQGDCPKVEKQLTTKCEEATKKAQNYCQHGSPASKAGGAAAEAQGAQGQQIGSQQANQCQNQNGVGNQNQQTGNQHADDCDQAIQQAVEACTTCSSKNRNDQNTCQTMAAQEHAEAAQNPSKEQEAQQDDNKGREHGQEAKTCEQKMGEALKEKPKVEQARSQAGSEGQRAGVAGQCNGQSSTGGGMPQMPQMPKDDKKDDKKEQPKDPTAATTPPPSNSPEPTQPGTPGQAAIFGAPSPGAGLSSGSSPSFDSGGGGGSYGGGSGGSAPTGSATTGGGGGGFSGGGGASRNIAGDDKHKDQKGNANGVIGGTGGGGGGFGGGGGGGGHSGFASKEDFDKFMKRKEGQGVAGMSLKPIDGITGPMGASIFEKITKQYKLQQHNMVP